MPAPSTSDIANQVSALIDAWRGYTAQLRDWLAGTATGGPFSDGRYPLTDSRGNTFYVPSPAAQAARVDGEVSSALAFATSAEADRLAAQVAKSAAETALGLTLTYRDAAVAAKNLAETARAEAANSEANALVHRNASAASASSASQDAQSAAQDAAEAEAARAAAVAARLAAEAASTAAATFDPALYRRLDTQVPWADVSGKPATYAPSAHGHAWADLTGVPATASRWPSWAEVTERPSTFAPSAHTHTIGEVSGLQTALDARYPITGGSLQGSLELLANGRNVRLRNNTGTELNLDIGAGYHGPTDDHAYIYNRRAAGFIAIGAGAGAQELTVAPAGVGIGTRAPAGRLHVVMPGFDRGIIFREGRIDSVTASNSAFAPLGFTATEYRFNGGHALFEGALVSRRPDNFWGYLAETPAGAARGGIWLQAGSILLTNGLFNAGVTVTDVGEVVVAGRLRGVEGGAGARNVDTLQGSLGGHWTTDAPGSSGHRGGWHQHFNLPGHGGRDMQLAWFTGGDNGGQAPGYRTWSDSGFWNPWRTFWTSANFNPDQKTGAAFPGAIHSITSADNRVAVNTPSDFTRGVFHDFKTTAAAGFGAQNFAHVMSVSQWHDDSGGGVHQLIFTDPGRIGYRYGTRAGGWAPVHELFHTGNLAPVRAVNNAAPDVNGNVLVPELTGHARYGVAASFISDWNAATSAGFAMAAGAPNAPNAQWLLGQVQVHNGDWLIQTVQEFTAGFEGREWRRHRTNGTWGAWTARARVADSTAFSPGAPSESALTSSGAFGGGLVQRDGSVWTGMWTQNDSTLRFGIGGAGGLTMQVLFDASGDILRRNADSGTMTRQPRIFIGGSDPGAAAAEGDLWITET